MTSADSTPSHGSLSCSKACMGGNGCLAIDTWKDSVLTEEACLKSSTSNTILCKSTAKATQSCKQLQCLRGHECAWPRKPDTLAEQNHVYLHSSHCSACMLRWTEHFLRFPDIALLEHVALCQVLLCFACHDCDVNILLRLCNSQDSPEPRAHATQGFQQYLKAG